MPLMPVTQIQAVSGVLNVISDTNVAVATASIDITGIPASYRHLWLLADIRSDRAGSSFDFADVFLNNDGGGSSYDSESVEIVGPATTSIEELLAVSTPSFGHIPASTALAGTSASLEILIPNYTNTVFHKNLVYRLFAPTDSSSGSIQWWDGGFTWRNTAAVNRITMLCENGNLIAGCRVTLYGL